MDGKKKEYCTSETHLRKYEFICIQSSPSKDSNLSVIETD